MRVTWGRIIVFLSFVYCWLEREKSIMFYSRLKWRLGDISKGVLSVYVIAPLFRFLYGRTSSEKKVFEALDIAVKHLSTKI